MITCMVLFIYHRITFYSKNFQVSMGVFRLGFIAVFFSDALAQAFTCASACHIVVSQLPNLLGISNMRSTPGVGAFFLVSKGRKMKKKQRKKKNHVYMYSTLFQTKLTIKTSMTLELTS